MSRTVDLVVVGIDVTTITAVLAAARRGKRVLVVVRSSLAREARPLRQSLRAAGDRVRRHVTVMTGAEVVCVDGISRIEAVVIRRLRTGELIGVNASAVLFPADESLTR